MVDFGDAIQYKKQANYLEFDVTEAFELVSVKVRGKDFNENGELVDQIIKTTVGRVLFNEVVPEKAGFINEVLTKRSLRDIIGDILKVTDVPTTGEFLDNIKNMGYKFAFQGGLSFSLGDIIIPEEKYDMIDELKKGGTFLLNSPYSKDEIWEQLPEEMQKHFRWHFSDHFTLK